MRALEHVILKVKIGSTCLTKNTMGHFNYNFEKARNTKGFDCDWCFCDPQERAPVEGNIKKIKSQKGKSPKNSVKTFWDTHFVIKADYGSDNPSDPLPPTPLWNLKTLNTENDVCKNPL